LIDEYNSRRSPWDSGDDYSSVGLFYESLHNPRRGGEWRADSYYNPRAIEQDSGMNYSGRKRDYYRPVRFTSPYGYGSMTLVDGPKYTDYQHREDDVPFTDF